MRPRAAQLERPIRRPRNFPRWCFVRLVREPGTELLPGMRVRGPSCDPALILRSNRKPLRDLTQHKTL